MSEVPDLLPSGLLLDTLTDDDLLLLLSSLDHQSVCRARAACARLRTAGSSQYVWRNLYGSAARATSVLLPPTDWFAAFKRFINAAWDDPVLDAASGATHKFASPGTHNAAL